MQLKLTTRAIDSLLKFSRSQITCPEIRRRMRIQHKWRQFQNISSCTRLLWVHTWFSPTDSSLHIEYYAKRIGLTMSTTEISCSRGTYSASSTKRKQRPGGTPPLKDAFWSASNTTRYSVSRQARRGTVNITGGGGGERQTIDWRLRHERRRVL